MWIVFIVLAITLVVGGLLILLRTAGIPRLPENYKPKSHHTDDQDEDDW